MEHKTQTKESIKKYGCQNFKWKIVWPDLAKHPYFIQVNQL